MPKIHRRWYAVSSTIRTIPMEKLSRIEIYDDQVPVSMVDLCRQRWADVLAKRLGISRETGAILSPSASKGQDQLIWTLRSADSEPPWPHSSQSPSCDTIPATPRESGHKLRKKRAWYYWFFPNSVLVQCWKLNIWIAPASVKVTDFIQLMLS